MKLIDYLIFLSFQKQKDSLSWKIRRVAILSLTVEKSIQSLFYYNFNQDSSCSLLKWNERKLTLKINHWSSLVEYVLSFFTFCSITVIVSFLNFLPFCPWKLNWVHLGVVFCAGVFFVGVFFVCLGGFWVSFVC